MKLTIISDTHLSPYFEKDKLIFLEKLISSSEKIIINGDFWDGYFWEFKDFTESPWKKLFPILKKKHTIYITGNHDKEYLVNKNLAKKLFCKEVLIEYEIKINGKTYHIEHGHRILPFADIKLNLDLKNKFIKSILKTIKLTEKLIFKTPAKKLLKELYYKAKAKEISKKLNKKEGVFYIFGHVHYPTLDEKKQIATSGSIEYGLAEWIEIIDKPYLKQKHY